MVPYMFDSSVDGGYSEDLSYSIEPIDKVNDTYKLVLTVSKEYLEDEKRVYPVTIDPTYTANTSTKFKDVYIESGYPTTNFYSSSVRKMPIGYGSTDKICRTLLKFDGLQSAIKNNYISSATLKLYEWTNSKPFAKVQVH